ncbi:MAG: N-acetylneuraminate synthase family protein, partial [Phycisphaerales bacterium]|nr:N-acetylneuraminate synthase family protein [Phycisphaerales bacterium]
MPSTNPLVRVGTRDVGNGQPCFVIAEAGLNHNGELPLALELIDKAIEGGADAVKFQKRTVDVLAVADVLDAEDARFPSFGRTYRQIREHLEFDLDEYRELVAHAAKRGIPFLCTPFDVPALEFLERLALPGYKIASHSVTNLPLLERVAEVGKPVIMSTGMCTFEEIDRAVDVFTRRGTPLALMHCVSAYPTPMNQCNLRMVDALRDRYHVPVGYSGHELGYVPTLAAVA